MTTQSQKRISNYAVIQLTTTCTYYRALNMATVMQRKHTATCTSVRGAVLSDTIKGTPYTCPIQPFKRRVKSQLSLLGTHPEDRGSTVVKVLC